MSTLTPMQQKVLSFIVTSKQAHGYPPTRQEIASHFGWASANAAQDHLIALEKKGWLEIKDKTARGIILK